MFFRVFTALILLFSTSVLIAEDVFKGEIFPLKFMPDEDYTIAENIPAVFCVNTWAVTEDAKRNLGGGKPVMILEPVRRVYPDRIREKASGVARDRAENQEKRHGLYPL